MHTITPVLDSGAGPNLIHLRCVAEPWCSAIKSARCPPLMDVSNRSMNSLGELTLYVWIGEFVARIPFLVVTNLAVDCILGTTFLDGHVKAILLLERKVMFHHAPSVAMTGTTPSRHDCKMASRCTSQKRRQEQGSTDGKRARFSTNLPSRKTHVVKGVTILPMTKVMDRVAIPVESLGLLQKHPKTTHKTLCLMAQGSWTSSRASRLRCWSANLDTARSTSPSIP